MIHDVLPPDCFFSLSLSLPYLLYRRVEQSVARQVHNLKVVGSNPTPAPILSPVRPTGKDAWLRTTKSGFESWAGGQ